MALALGAALALAVAGAAIDWRMLHRHLVAPEEPIGSTGWYAPTAIIGEGRGGDLPVAAPDERTVGAAAFAAALAYAREHGSYALLIAHRGVIQYEYYRDGFDADRLLDSQSLHKPLAAIVTMAAVADGHLSLDDPLGRFIPQWRADERGGITLRDVLYMQTGLAAPRFEERLGNEAYRLFITSRLDEALLTLAAEAPPGEHYRSHYAATQLLQLALASATGRRYEEYLNERLWSRLDAGIARVRLDRPGGSAQIFCCLEARPRDWLRIGLMLLDEGRFDGRIVLPEPEFRQLLEPSPLAPNFAMQQIWHGSPYAPVRMSDSRNPARGLPMSAPFLADDVFYLEGRGGQRVYVVPSRQLVVVRQGVIRMDWDDAAFLNTLLVGE